LTHYRSVRRRSSRQSLALVRTTKFNSKINQTDTKTPIYYLHTHAHKHDTNKKCTHAQSNYTNTKLTAWFRCLLCHLARKWSGHILHPWTHAAAL